jgi:hypothetical protein
LLERQQFNNCNGLGENHIPQRGGNVVININSCDKIKESRMVKMTYKNVK